MIRILIATALLIAAFTVSAFAHTDTATVDVGVQVDAFCYVSYDDNSTPETITVDEIAELEDLYAESDAASDDTLTYNSSGVWSLTFSDNTPADNAALSVFIGATEFGHGDTIDSGLGADGEPTGVAIDKYAVAFTTEPTVGPLDQVGTFTMTCSD